MLEVGQVEALGAQGEGIVRNQGKVVFVPGTLPGEQIRFARYEQKGRFDRGRLEDIVVPSPHRRTSPCSLDRPGGCGGCNFLHIQPAVASQTKSDWLQAELQRVVGTAVDVESPAPCGSGLGYRNHARFLVVGGQLAYVGRPELGVSGRAHVTVGTCPVLHPSLDALIPILNGRRLKGVREVELRTSVSSGERMVILEAPQFPKDIDPPTLDANIVWSSPDGITPLRGLPWMTEIVDGVRLRVSHDAFFQSNPTGVTVLVNLVRSLLPPLGPETWAVDLYSGVGLFSLTGLRGAGRVTAVEGSPAAFRDLQANAAAHRGVTAILSDATDYLKDLAAVQETPDVVVADPPRGGLGDEGARLLAQIAPPTVILVSCHPSALARDAATLIQGGYRPGRCVPVDQFGGTHHLEAVMALHRSNG